jgi:hypothetical protein
MAINKKIAAIAGGFVLAGGLVAIAPGHSTRSYRFVIWG